MVEQRTVFYSRTTRLQHSFAVIGKMPENDTDDTVMARA